MLSKELFNEHCIASFSSLSSSVENCRANSTRRLNIGEKNQQEAFSIFCFLSITDIKTESTRSFKFKIRDINVIEVLGVAKKGNNSRKHH